VYDTREEEASCSKGCLETGWGINESVG
jgi:hypothetical protein